MESRACKCKAATSGTAKKSTGETSRGRTDTEKTVQEMLIKAEIKTAVETCIKPDTDVTEVNEPSRKESHTKSMRSEMQEQ